LDLPLDDLIINYGFTSSLTHLKEWGLDVSRNAINVHSDMSTNIPGVYAVGDICSYEGKVKLIATGFGEAPTAVNNALHYLRPDARRQPVHSTSLFENGVPK
jgi:thioredoxin reductase (NADPH)